MKLDGKTLHQSSVRVVEGGTASMRSISAEIKARKESAVLVLENESTGSRGYVSFRVGNIVEAFFRKTRNGIETESFSGREALIRVWREALDKRAHIKIYSTAPEEEKQDERSEMELQQWLSMGYVIDNWLKTIKKGGEEGRNAFEELRRRIEKMKDMEKELERMKGKASEEERQRLLSLTRRPDSIGELEIGLALLKKKNPKKVNTEKDEYDEMLSLVFNNGGRRCERCGNEMEGDVCQHCGGKQQVDASGLNPYMKFSNFVIGDNSKFSHAAALSVASGEGKQYNPLFIHSSNGLGKTHLLNAIGNYVKEKGKGSPIYIGAERLLQPDGLPKTDGFDYILLDDMHLLAENPQIQTQLLAILEGAVRSGSKVVATAIKEPSRIRGLDPQLSSRFESGLVVEIKPPEQETRMRILERKCEELKYSVPEEVLRFIAENVEDNVRELTGALVKMMAYSSIMKSGPSIELAKKVLKPNEKKEGSAMELRPGHGYLIEEDRASLCHMLVQSLSSDGWDALDITRINPSKLKSKYPGLGKARVLWLTDRENENMKTLEPSLEKIEFEIMNFIEGSRGKGKGAVVNIDDIQYVISNTNFEGTIRLLRRIIDEMSVRNSILIVSVGRETLSKQEIAVLERELELIQ
jgi:chromosomal replication initiation ATPase DnaA